MEDTFAPLLALLNGSIVPRLQEIQATLAEQRLQATQVERAIDELRSTMALHFAEVRADFAACHARMEDILVTLRENEKTAATTSPGNDPALKKTLPN